MLGKFRKARLPVSENWQARNTDILVSIIENLPTPVYVKDADLRFIIANRAQRAVCGKNEAELIGKTDAEIHASDLAAAYMDRERKLLATRQEYVIEEMVDDNTTKRRTPVLTRKSVIAAADGNTYILGTNSDLSEIKKREAQNQILAEAVPVGVLKIEENGTVTFANSRVLDYLGLDRPPASLLAALNLLSAPPVNFPGQASRFESPVRRPGQSVIHLLVESSGWKRVEGEERKSAIISFVDISESTALRENFAAQTHQLDSVLKQTKVNLSKIGASTNSLNSSAVNLAHQTDGQMASLEEMSAAIRELADAVKQNANDSQEARNLALAARSTAEEGNQISITVTGTIAKISESNHRILSIIDLVQEIAFQTNLLSLNAAVEAARAGQLGSGFAVVAAEVRTLAQRSAGALKDIQIHIRDSKQQLAESTALAESLSTGMAKMQQTTRLAAKLIENISTACREQAEGIQQIDTSINHLEGAAQSAAQLAEEVTQSVASVDQAIGTLSRIVRDKAA